MRGRPVPEGWKRPYLEALGLGKRLRELREAAGLSRPELAARAGTTRSHLRKLEAGDHAPRPEMATRLAAALGVDEAAFSTLHHAPPGGGESRPEMTGPTRPQGADPSPL